jgi:hypothetical protein
MMFGLLGSIAVVTLLSVLLLRRPPKSWRTPPNPHELAETLEWREGSRSPNGRRVLWVQHASRTLLSMTQSTEGAAFFGSNCAVDPEELAHRLPEGATETSVHWPIAQDEGIQLLLWYRPEVMEDKWLIVPIPSSSGIRLFFLRSWTGVLVYVLEWDKSAVHTIWAAEGDRLAEPMLRALMDGYLLGKPLIVPAPSELGDDKLKLLMHGIQWAGRHCDAVESGRAL